MSSCGSRPAGARNDRKDGSGSAQDDAGWEWSGRDGVGVRSSGMSGVERSVAH